MQQDILENFRRYYPKLSIRETAKITGINSARLYRILNGQDMKVSEYEAFQGVINLYRRVVTNRNHMFDLVTRCCQVMDERAMAELFIEIKHRLNCYELINHIKEGQHENHFDAV